MGERLKDVDALAALTRDRPIIVKKPAPAAAADATAIADAGRQGTLEIPAAPAAAAPAVSAVTRRGARRQEVGQAGGDDSDEEEGDGAVLTAGAEGVGQSRSYAVSLSSETPVEQWFGNEILDHSAGSVDLSRSEGMPLLLNHRSDQQIGAIRNLRLSKDRKLRGDMLFSKSAAAIEQDVIDGIRTNLSLGYRVGKFEYEEGKGDKPDTYTATRWTPMEASIVSVPADHTVGVNRSSADSERFPVLVVKRNAPATAIQGATSMPEAPAANAGNGATAPNNGAAAAEIVRMGQTHGLLDRVPKWIEDGRTPDQVRAEILETRATKPIVLPAAEDPNKPGLMPDKDAKRYSYARAILAAADTREGQRGTSCFELDVSQELEKSMPVSYKRMGGVFVPTRLTNAQGAGTGMRLSDGQRAAMMDYLTRAGGSGTIDSITANYIKEVVFTEYGGELINILRNAALVVRMGARVLTGLSSPIAFPRQTQDVSAVWQATENPGSDIAAGNVKTDLVSLIPRTLMAATAYSRQLLVQASVDVEAMVRESLAFSHAIAWDLAAIHGSGSSGQPTGIYNQSGVLTEDFSTFTTPGQLNYGQIVDMETKVANANALLGTLGWLTTPGTAKKGKTTLEFAVNGASKIWMGTILEGEMDGYKAMATNQVAKLMGTGGAGTGGVFHGLIYGNWSDLLIGQWGGAMEMIVDPYTLKKQALIEVASFQMTDVEVRHPVSFCVAINMNPAL